MASIMPSGSIIHSTLRGCRGNKSEPSADQAHLEDGNSVIAGKDIRYSCRASLFLSPWRLPALFCDYFFFPHQKTATTPWRDVAPALADGGCGKQIEVSFLKKSLFKFTLLSFHLPLEASLSRQKRRRRGIFKDPRVFPLHKEQS